MKRELMTVVFWREVMKKALMIAVVAILAIGLFSAVSDKEDELGVITITAPRYRPEKEDGKVELIRKTPTAEEVEPGFLGEYRATIRCGEKCRKAAPKKR